MLLALGVPGMMVIALVLTFRRTAYVHVRKRYECNMHAHT